MCPPASQQLYKNAIVKIMNQDTFRFIPSANNQHNQEIQALSERLEKYPTTLAAFARHQDYTQPESSLFLAQDPRWISEVNSLVSQLKTQDLQYLFVIGIGGSRLGTQAVYDALWSQLNESLNQHPQLFFIDMISEQMLADISELLDTISQPEEILINIISKSGQTLETVHSFDQVYSLFQTKFPDTIDSRIIATTSLDSPLWQRATQHGWQTLQIPAVISGRYSVFSSVGLFPLACAGVDIQALISGGQEILKACLIDSSTDNPAIHLASEIATAYQHGNQIYTGFFFDERLASLGQWQRQLLGESLNKTDTHGQKIHLFPDVAIGPRDLHSMLQYYLNAEINVLTTFITIAQPTDPTINALYQATINSYIQHNLTLNEISLPEISAYALGQYFQYMMLVTLFLAHIFDVDPFNQPDIESYKTKVQQILNQ